jgi:hypothetical protein
MYLALFENIEIFYILNVIFATILLYLVIKKSSQVSALSTLSTVRNFVIIVLLLLLFIDSISSNIKLFRENEVNQYYYLNLLLVNTTLILSSLALWMFYYRKYPKRRSYLLNFSMIALLIIMFGAIITLNIIYFSKVQSLLNLFLLEIASGKAALKLLFYLVILFSFTAICLFIAIIIIRIIRDFRNNLVEKYKKHLRDLISNYLFADTDDKERFKVRIQAFIKDNRFRKEVTIQQILNLHKGVSGNLVIDLRELYFFLNLQNISLKKINNRKWYIKAQGFREISEMQYLDLRKEIKSNINSNNLILRGEAVFATSNMYKQNSNVCFLANYKHKISIWEQINLHYNSIINKKKIENLDAILNSENESIVLFGIKIIGINKLSKYYNHLVEILSSDLGFKYNEKLRNAAYISLKNMNETDVDFLIANYYKESYKNQLQILNLLAYKPSNTFFTFLRQVLESNSDNKIRLACCKAIEALGSPLNLYLDKIIDNNDELAIYALHYRQKRIII